jgi:hypothetical protein
LSRFRSIGAACTLLARKALSQRAFAFDQKTGCRRYNHWGTLFLKIQPRQPYMPLQASPRAFDVIHVFYVYFILMKIIMQF